MKVKFINLTLATFRSVDTRCSMNVVKCVPGQSNPCRSVRPRFGLESRRRVWWDRGSSR